MTCGPLRSKTLSVSPYEGEDLVPEVERSTGPCVSPLHRGEQEGSSPHRRGPVPGGRWNPGPCVSLQRMTCGPLQARPSLSLPMRERTWFRRLSETPALASLPLVGENKRGLPTPGFCDFSIGGPILAEGRTSCSGRSLSTIVQESQNQCGPMIRSPAGDAAGAWRRSRCQGGATGAGARRSSQVDARERVSGGAAFRRIRPASPSLWPVKTGTPSASAGRTSVRNDCTSEPPG